MPPKQEAPPDAADTAAAEDTPSVDAPGGGSMPDGMQAQLDKLASTVSEQKKELDAMKQSQAELRAELKAIREERDALLVEAQDLRARSAKYSPPSRDTDLTQRPAQRPVPMTRGAATGARTPQISPQCQSFKEPPSLQPSPGSGGFVANPSSPKRAEFCRKEAYACTEEEAAEDARRGGIYGLSQPLLRPGVKEKVKAAALASVCKALVNGQPPHSWAGPGTPLSAAVKGRSFELVRVLLEHHGDPDERDAKGVSLMHQAAYDGQVEMCRLLLEMHSDPNALDRYGQTPLFFAPTRSVCELLYKAYADVNTMNHKGQSALHLAARAGLGDVLTWLSTRVTRALLCLRDANGCFATDYARRAGVRPEAILKVEQVAGGGLTRDWNKAKQRHGGAGRGKNVVAPGFEPAGQSPMARFDLQERSYSEDVVSDADDDCEQPH